MKQLAIIAKRYSYAATAALLTLAMAAPALISGSSSAAQLTQRSIQPSTVMAGAEDVTYQLKFTAASDGGVQAVVVDFCSDPLSGFACTAPSGTTFEFGDTVSGAVTTGTAFTGTWSVAPAVASATAITIESTAVESVTAGDEWTIDVSGFVNPSEEQTVYARIHTFASTAAADLYESAAPGGYEDNGSAAFAIVTEIDVTAIVRETLTFCVSGMAPTPGCAGNITAPSVKLGDEVDTGVFVIDNQDVYTGSVYYQLSTNATNATTINIKGLSNSLTSGSNEIAGVGDTPATITAGQELFGVRVPVAGDVNDPTDGSDMLVEGGAYDTALWSMPTAVEGTYGSTFATAAGPVLNAAGQLEFGASAAANTEAGVYTARYSLIATPSY